MQRYFVEIDNVNINFLDDDIHHILRVMRNKIGDQIEIVDKLTNNLFVASIVSTNPFECKIEYEIPTDSELPYDVTLFYCLAKGDKNELVVQKCTELGVKRVVFIASERCVVKWDEKDMNKKLERFRKIAKEASEQSHRTIVPEILGAYSINKIPQDLLAENNYFAYEKIAGKTEDLFTSLTTKQGSISILVGPEGGFSEKEADLVVDKFKFIPVSLGKRILRSETSAIYALSVISFALERN